MDTTVFNLTILDLEKLVHRTRGAITETSKLPVGDPNFEPFYKRSIEASQHTLELAESFRQREKNIPPYDAVRVQGLIFDVRGSYLVIEDIVHEFLEESASPSHLKSITQGETIMQRSYKNLEEQLKAIAISNVALNEILLKIPSHSLLVRHSSGLSIISAGEYRIDASQSATSSSEHVDLGRVDGRPTESQSQSQSYIDPISMSSLHALCLDCLIHISFITTSKARKLAGLLERWSIGLFDKIPVTLDSLLIAKDNSNKNLRQFILRTLVNIAIAEERICQIVWNTDEFPEYPYKGEPSKSQQRILKKEEEKSILAVDERLSGVTHKHRTALHLMLNHSELTDFALQRWDELLELEVEDNTEEDLDEEQLTSIDCELDEIEYLIESLFDVSSSIRAARHSHILEVQKSAQIVQQEKSPAELNKTKNEVEPPVWRTDLKNSESGNLLKMEEFQRKERLGARDSSVTSKLIKDNDFSTRDRTISRDTEQSSRFFLGLTDI